MYNEPADAITHFGFRVVPASEKGGLVNGIFHSVAGRYDLMNDLMSGGLHRLWKRAVIDWLRPRPDQHYVDIACGTGDIALRIMATTRGQARVTACDASPEMLKLGQGRAIDRGVVKQLSWLCSNAEMLPIASNSVDGYTIAFGLRNVTRIDRALMEARRVLKPGGHFLCLEFSQVAVPLLGYLYDRYSFAAIPWLGHIVAGDRAAYQYLVESIRQFPPQHELAEMIVAANLGRVSVHNLTGGIVALHSAWKI